MKDDALTLERAVAQFVVDFGARDLDLAARESVKMLIKDQLAIQVGASQLPWSKQVREFRKPRPGTATIVGERTKAAAADAAYLNATYGHGFEYDDFIGNAHPGCCVVPTAFALAEELGASLEHAIVALAVAYETYSRIGRLASPALINAGWQSHSVLANFGAAALAAKLYGLDAKRTLHALAIALSHAGGTTEYASTGGSIKRVHAGMAVRNGIESAELARAGITGPLRFLTGSRGLYRNFCHVSVGDEAAINFQAGAPLMLPQMMFKAYCCCALTHSYIEAMAQVRGRARDVVDMTAKLQTMTNTMCGTRNAHIYQPRNIEELQYSLPAQMALSALDFGNGYKTHRDFLEGRLQLRPDSEVIQLARRIKLEVSPELDEKYGLVFVADVTVRYRDGTSQHIFVERATGSPNKPFTAAQHQAKLDELTDEVIGRRQARELWQMIDRLDPGTPVGTVTALLVPQ